MKELVCTITRFESIAKDVFEMELENEDPSVFSDLRAGQFVNLTIEGFYLRRPISVCDSRDGKLVLVFKILGQGTRELAKLTVGDKVAILSPLGNGFQLVENKKTVLVGGGVGVPPLYFLAKKLLKQGVQPKVALGFASKEDVFYVKEFQDLGLEVKVATVDGSDGVQGFVTRIIEEDFTDTEFLYCCGPIPMLRALHELNIPGEFSFEERMGCGFGACMGCSWKVKGGYKRVCKEGPVFQSEEIIW